MASSPPPPPQQQQQQPAPFTFPREYFFPPFFTRQTNLTTQHAQLTKWAALVLSYCRHHRIFKLSLAPNNDNNNNNNNTNQPQDLPPSSSSSPPKKVDTSDLFHNRKINRRLSLEDARLVIDFLRKDGRAEYLSPDDNKEKDVAWIYWRTPEEWAALIEAWLDETGQRGGTVLTLYELVHGDGTRGTGKSSHTFFFVFFVASEVL